MRCLTILLLSCIPAASYADAQTDSLDAYVQREMHERHIPGLALAIVRNGELVKAQGYGFANLEHRVPVTPATIFQSGSVGKQFTATAVVLLADEGQLDLDDPIGKYLDGSPETWKDVTIRHVLTHRIPRRMGRSI